MTSIISTQVQQHKSDFSSLEVSITALTIQIRNNQHHYTLLNPHGDKEKGHRRLNTHLGKKDSHVMSTK